MGVLITATNDVTVAGNVEHLLKILIISEGDGFGFFSEHFNGLLSTSWNTVAFDYTTDTTLTLTEAIRSVDDSLEARVVNSYGFGVETPYIGYVLAADGGFLVYDDDVTTDGVVVLAQVTTDGSTPITVDDFYYSSHSGMSRYSYAPSAAVMFLEGGGGSSYYDYYQDDLSGGGVNSDGDERIWG